MGSHVVKAPMNNSINIFDLLTNSSKEILRKYILSEEIDNIDYK